MAMVKKAEVTPSSDEKPCPRYEQLDTRPAEAAWKSNGAALGGLMHDAAQLAAAVIMANGLKADKALEAFDTMLAGVIAAREKLDKGA